MSTNVLSNVGLILNVCEKSPKNTDVIGTKTGAVPWPITSVFPELKITHSLLTDCIHPVIVLRDLGAPLAPAPAPLPTPPLSLSSSLSPRQPLPPFLRCPLGSTKTTSHPPPPSPRQCHRDDAKRWRTDCEPWRTSPGQFSNSLMLIVGSQSRRRRKT
jgi:hypothetical protein